MENSENFEMGITKTKKHSMVLRFDLSKPGDRNALHWHTSRPSEITVVQIKEYPTQQVAYIEAILTDIYKKIYLGETD